MDGCHEGDGDGHIGGEFAGLASFHIAAHECDNGDEGGDVEVKDDGAGVDFHSTQILSVAYDAVAQTMTVVGEGLDHGTPVTFTAVETDGLAPALKAFGFEESDGYSNAGNLVDGNITIN